MTEYRYHWQLDERAWYVRFYLWLWQGDPRRVDFCKLFWGYVLVIPGLILRGLLAIADLIGHIGEDKREKRVIEIVERLDNPPRREPRKPPAWMKSMQAFLDAFATAAARTIMKASPAMRLLGRALPYIARVVIFAVGVGAVGFTIAAIVIWWGTAKWVLLAVGLALLLFIAMVLLANLLERAGLFAWLNNHPPGDVGKPFRATGHGIARFFEAIGDFFHVMGLGYRAVKTNTCPKVEIVKRP